MLIVITYMAIFAVLKMLKLIGFCPRNVFLNCVFLNPVYHKKLPFVINTPN